MTVVDSNRLCTKVGYCCYYLFRECVCQSVDGGGDGERARRALGTYFRIDIEMIRIKVPCEAKGRERVSESFREGTRKLETMGDGINGFPGSACECVFWSTGGNILIMENVCAWAVNCGDDGNVMIL